MQVAIHLGAHCTDDDRLLKSLLSNKNMLARQGISVPGPGRYRELLKDSARRLKGDPASPDLRARIHDEILHDGNATRVVLSDENFICVHARIFEGGVLYDKSSYKCRWLRQLFAGDQVEFFLGIRNPASFIPSAFRHPDQRYGTFEQFFAETDVMDVRWSDVIVTIRETNPGCPITVWCNEDTPLIWSEILRVMTGHDPQTRLKDDFNILQAIMKPVGLKRMNAYLAANPPGTEIQYRRVIAAFLEKFAIEEEIEEEVDAPGWTEDLVTKLTEIYEQDLFEIKRLPGVTFLSP